MSKVISDVRVASHATSAEQPITARASIAHHQKGGWVMLLGGKHHAGGTDVIDVPLGVGAELKGSHLEVSAALQDVRPETDELKLTVDVIGASTTTVTIAHTVQPGDSAGYSVIVSFI